MSLRVCGECSGGGVCVCVCVCGVSVQCTQARVAL